MYFVSTTKNETCVQRTEKYVRGIFNVRLRVSRETLNNKYVQIKPVDIFKEVGRCFEVDWIESNLETSG